MFFTKWSQNVSKLLLFNISVLIHVVMIVKFYNIIKTLKANISKVEKSQTCETRTHVTQKRDIVRAEIWHVDC